MKEAGRRRQGEGGREKEAGRRRQGEGKADDGWGKVGREAGRGMRQYRTTG